MMGRFFLGKPVHWLVIAAIVGVLWWMGANLVQTRDYHLFLIVLPALTVAAVAVVIVTTRPGDRVTRDPFEDDDGA